MELRNRNPGAAASTALASAFFDPGWEKRLGITYGDLQWSATGERLTKASFERLRKGPGNVIAHMIPEDVVETAIASPLVMIGSDGMPYGNGGEHPRGAGTFSRVLGRYVRERGTIGLMDAIRKMSLMPADRLAVFLAGLTIFAPSLILSTILGWSLFWTNLALGSFVVIYTAAGGSRAVDWTHVHQMIVIFCGLFVALGMVIWMLPDGVSFADARGQLVDQVPDVGEQVVVFAWSFPIPNDGFAVAGDLPEDLKEAITAAFIDIASTPDGTALLQELYEIDGLVPVDPAAFDEIRDLRTELADLLE